MKTELIKEYFKSDENPSGLCNKKGFRNKPEAFYILSLKKINQP